MTTVSNKPRIIKREDAEKRKRENRRAKLMMLRELIIEMPEEAQKLIKKFAEGIV